jgi:alkanesulfonate monooxygenase SsuD/methylene tetrahydromethanopterin reductase-like flavin-dependent oxidoreductase (luciferase family)
VSAPAVVLAAASQRTTRIRLTSAVSVISSDDPVRVFQEFSTLDLLSNGRAEIMAGRGSFIESYPLFGYDLAQYDSLFAEKLGLLLELRKEERIAWSGKHRAPLAGQGVYPRPVQEPLPVWIAVGGTPQSAARAGALGIPMALAIIGGMPERFAGFVELYREAGRRAGHPDDALRLGINSHGFIAEDSREAVDVFYPPYPTRWGASAPSGAGRPRAAPSSRRHASAAARCSSAARPRSWTRSSSSTRFSATTGS